MTMNEKELAKIKELRNEGETVWSISRLNSMNTCQYGYYNSYVLKNRGIGNCYSASGTEIHEKMELIYKDQYDTSNFSKDLESKLAENEILGLDFPSDLIRDNFTKDVKHFTENFKKLDGKFILEKLLLFKLDDHYIQGYIDAIQVIENEEGNKEINILDWKVSSKFSGAKKLQDAGRQLLMYKYGLDLGSSKTKINTVKWCMIKYLYVNYLKAEKVINYRKCKIDGWVKTIRKAIHKSLLAEGFTEEESMVLMDISVANNNLNNLPESVKNTYWLEDYTDEDGVSDTHISVCSVKSERKYGKKMCSRRKWVSDVRGTLEKDMLNNGVDELEVDILLDEAVKNNNIDNLPQFIKDKYWIEDCYVDYEVTEDRIQELKDYVNHTIELINSKNPNDESEWKPVDFEKDSFYCNHLCNHRQICKFLKDYKKGLNLGDKPSVTLDDIL